MSSQPLKRYALFYGMHYYGRGGWCDFQGSFDEAKEAQCMFLERYVNSNLSGIDMWVQVIDLTSGKVEISGRIASDGSWFECAYGELEGGYYV